MGAGMAVFAATTALQIGTQYVQGRQEQKAYEYNASVIEGQIPAIEAAKQTNRLRAINDRQRMVSAQVAAVASQGIELTGSPIEVINADYARAEFDLAVDDYNFELEKTRVYNEAQQQRFYGQQAKKAGILKGIGTLADAATTAYSFRGAKEAPLGKNYTKIKTSAGTGYRQGSLILSGGRRGYYHA